MISFMKITVQKNCLVLLMVVIKSRLIFIPRHIRLHTYHRDASLNAEDMATQSVRLKEEQLRKEEEKVG